LQEKSAGNAAYKAKRFDEAIEHYSKAIDIYDKDVSFITNRAAAHFEKGDYGEAIKDCELAVEKAREMRPIDFKLVAKCAAAALLPASSCVCSALHDLEDTSPGELCLQQRGCWLGALPHCNDQQSMYLAAQLCAGESS
jgi:tetratricopeptide (TPR) repeat protein